MELHPSVEEARSPVLGGTGSGVAMPSEPDDDSLINTITRPSGARFSTNPSGVRISMNPAGANPRATVLPRVEMIGREPRLIAENRRRFELLRHLGGGGVGEVVGMQDHDIGRQVAMKRLRADVQCESTLARFVDEIRIVGSLEHPNIVPIHDVGIDETGEYYFVMKLVDGETLQTVIEKLAAGDAEYHRRYTIERRVQIFGSVVEAVAFAHEKGIIHRDIKPANVMVGRHGEVMLMDWGIAKSIHGPDLAAMFLQSAPPTEEGVPSGQRVFKTQVGSIIGTPAYMSPEQARGEEVDERSDVYALCVLLHELVYLKHYLADKRTVPEVLTGVLFEEPLFPYKSKSPYQPLPPLDLVWFMRDGIQKDKKDRYTSVAVMRELLERRSQGKIAVRCPTTFTARAFSELSQLVQRQSILFMSAMTGVILALILYGVFA